MSETSTTPDQKVIVVGDLHLFAARSRGLDHWEQLPGRIAASNAGRCVLMGDIFDFPWARQLGKKRAITKAASMVEELIAKFPSTQFHYLYGNHDQHPEFEHQLELHGNTFGNLTCHSVCLRIANTVFMHGDAADRRDMDTETMVRRRRDRTTRPLHGGIHEFLYGLAVRLRIDEAVTAPPFFPDFIHRRLIDFIERQGHENIEHIVYGHTHRKIQQHRYDGITFTNAGAPSGYRRYEHLTLKIRPSIPHQSTCGIS
ncbi:MAG: metallophosphoesterase [Akkermansiaceae bacterium]|nr:metallophosphoesterase [Akkermansiaceae bacterium]